MLECIKKFCTYFAAALTFLLALKAGFGVAFSWKWLAIVTTLVGIVCALIAWFETCGSSVKGRRRSQQSSDDSVILTIERALRTVRFAARDDEAIANQANRIVRRELDKRCVKYREYKNWRRKNPYIFTALTDSHDGLIGFFDVFPLTDEAAAGLTDGTYDEHSLTAEAILPCEKNSSAKKIYIASIVVNPKQTSFSPIVAKEILLIKLGEFLLSVFPPDGERLLFAFAHTGAGERLLKNANFRNTALGTDNKQHDPLYELSPEGYVQLATTFNSLLRGKRRCPQFVQEEEPTQ
jgi:hypothetical protein